MVFQAIADPTRRQIIGMLAVNSMNVNAIAEKFYITRQAVSLHVQYLNDCGLIRISKRGRERYCEAQLENLDVVSDWVAESKSIWLQQFRSLEAFLGKSARKNKITKRKTTNHASTNAKVRKRG